MMQCAQGVAKAQRVGVNAPFVPARVHARQQLFERAHVDVALPPVGREAHAEPFELVLCLIRSAFVLGGARGLLEGRLEREHLLPALARRFESLDVRLKPHKEGVRHERAHARLARRGVVHGCGRGVVRLHWRGFFCCAHTVHRRTRTR